MHIQIPRKQKSHTIFLVFWHTGQSILVHTALHDFRREESIESSAVGVSHRARGTDLLVQEGYTGPSQRVHHRWTWLDFRKFTTVDFLRECGALVDTSHSTEKESTYTTFPRCSTIVILRTFPQKSRVYLKGLCERTEAPLKRGNNPLQELRSVYT